MTYINKYITRLSPSFENELRDIYIHISCKLKEPLIAQKIYEEIITGIQYLKYYPNRHTKIYSYQKRNLRRKLINKYAIIYEIDDNTRSNFYSAHFSL